MRVPFLDLHPQLDQLGTEIKAAVGGVIDSARYVLGPVVESFEKSIAEYVGVQHAVGASSGTDALLMALMALDVGPGDVVVTTPYSFFATAGCVARLGAVPAFVDIDLGTYDLDPEGLRHWFETEGAEGSPVKAVIPVHLFGQCADMRPILEIARRFRTTVVEDAAQAIGARYPGPGGGRLRAGAMGALGCFSFYPSKNLGGLGDGGMVVLDDDALADKLVKLRNHGADRRYHHALIGGNFRLDPIQAAALAVKLPHLETWNAMRRERAAYYDQGLGGVDGLDCPATPYGRDCHTYHQYVIRVGERRDELAEYLRTAGVATAVYYPVPFHLQECFGYLGYSPGDFPNSEAAARQTLALPIYPELRRAMQDYVIEKIVEFYR